MKTVLLAPGFKEDLKFRDYASVIKAIEKAGYKVKFVPISWDRTTIDDWLDEFELEYSKHDPKETILAGFSFGAMVAFVAATKQNPFELWLFSLSPYFSEDIHNKDMRKSWLHHIGHRRVSAFNTLNFQSLAKTIQCKTLIFAGEIEMSKWPIMKSRAMNAHRLIQGSELIAIGNVEHDLSHKLYVDSIKQTI